MLSNNNEAYLTPDYIKKFKCVGHDCIDSCCTGWNIEIDKATYKKYINSSNNKINLITKQYVVKNKTESDLSYAKVVNRGKSCPFLADNKLCNAYSLLGKEHLSTGCSTYPRVIKKFNRKNFLAGEISCPEIAKLCLTNTNLKIKKYKKNELNNIFNSNNIHTFDIPHELSENTINYINKIFLKLSNQDTFFNNLEEIIVDFYKVYNKSDDLIRSNTSILEKKKLKEHNLLIQSNFLPKICFPKNFINNSRYFRICNEAAEKSRYFKLTKNQFKAKYIHNYKHKFNDFIQENNFILKNFFLNEFIKNIEVLNMSSDIFDDFIREVLFKITISNFLIICQSFEEKKITIDDYAEIISAVSKNTQNSQKTKELIINFFKKIDKNSLFLRLFDVY